MSSRLVTSWRLLPFAMLAGFVAVVAQSCDAKSKHDQAPITALPGSGGSADPQAGAGDPSAAPDQNTQAVEEGPKSCAKGGEECPEGTICCPRCCIAGSGPVCVKPTDDGKCPLPDLTVNQGALAQSPYIENIDATPCEVAEGCVDGPGKRRVLRFDVNIPNAGPSDLVLGNPDAGGANSPFQWAECHKHFHFKGFAHYELVDPANGNTVVAGRKQAFCAMDSMRVDRTAPIVDKYSCGDQGIQVGWEDSYPAGLPCQYIDITDLPTGKYRLQVHVNPDHAITESNYDNNDGAIDVNLP